MEGAVIPGLPEDLVARPLTWDDVNAIFRLEHACEAFDDGEAEIALSNFEAEWRRPAFDPPTMSVGVFDADRLVAYAEVFRSRAEAAVAPPPSNSAGETDVCGATSIADRRCHVREKRSP
jgi:hypothetical protein